MEERHWRPRVLVAFESKDLSVLSPERILAAAGGSAALVTVSAVVRRSALGRFAPLTGQMSPAEVEQDEVKAACEAARRLTAAFPTHVPVRHRAAMSWSEAFRIAGDHDVVVLGTARTRWWVSGPGGACDVRFVESASSFQSIRDRVRGFPTS